MCDYCINVEAEDAALSGPGGREHSEFIQRELLKLGIPNLMDYRFKDMVDPEDRVRLDREMEEWLQTTLP